MFDKTTSGYIHKCNVLRTLVFALLYFAKKTQPTAKSDKQPVDDRNAVTGMVISHDHLS
jgi:phage-related protein